MENAETDCRAVVARIQAYLDGEVAGLDCARIESHLAECRDCLDHAGFERELKALIARKCGETRVPEGLAERIQAMLRSRSH